MQVRELVGMGRFLREFLDENQLVNAYKLVSAIQQASHEDWYRGHA